MEEKEAKKKVVRATKEQKRLVEVLIKRVDAYLPKQYVDPVVKRLLHLGYEDFSDEEKLRYDIKMTRTGKMWKLDIALAIYDVALAYAINDDKITFEL